MDFTAIEPNVDSGGQFEGGAPSLRGITSNERRRQGRPPRSGGQRRTKDGARAPRPRWREAPFLRVADPIQGNAKATNCIVSSSRPEATTTYCLPFSS